MCTSRVSAHAFKAAYVASPSDQMCCSVVSLEASPLPLPPSAACDGG